jgi:hypothetical protein
MSIIYAIVLGAAFVAFSSLAGAATGPLTRDQLSDFPRWVYRLERANWWMRSILGGIVCAGLWLWAIAEGLGYK